MLSQEGQKIIATDSSMASGCTVRRQQTLLNPIDNRSGVDVKEAADFVCCINTLVAFGVHHSTFRQHVSKNRLNLTSRSRITFFNFCSDLQRANDLYVRLSENSQWK